MKDTQSIRVKWYFKLFSKLDNEQTNVDMTTRAFAYIIDWVLGSFVTAFPTVFMYMSYTKSKSTNFPYYHLCTDRRWIEPSVCDDLLCVYSSKSS